MKIKWRQIFALHLYASHLPKCPFNDKVSLLAAIKDGLEAC
jgi:hypothetical protein